MRRDLSAFCILFPAQKHTQLSLNWFAPFFQHFLVSLLLLFSTLETMQTRNKSNKKCTDTILISFIVSFHNKISSLPTPPKKYIYSYFQNAKKKTPIGSLKNYYTLIVTNKFPWWKNRLKQYNYSWFQEWSKLNDCVPISIM